MAWHGARKCAVCVNLFLDSRDYLFPFRRILFLLALEYSTIYTLYIHLYCMIGHCLDVIVDMRGQLTLYLGHTLYGIQCSLILIYSAVYISCVTVIPTVCLKIVASTSHIHTNIRNPWAILRMYKNI